MAVFFFAQIVNAENVLVVVSRWYGGIQLGPDRFKHINNCTRSILEQKGFLGHRVSSSLSFHQKLRNCMVLESQLLI